MSKKQQNLRWLRHPFPPKRRHWCRFPLPCTTQQKPNYVAGKLTYSDDTALMIVFSALQIRRGIRVLLDNATATINP
ncbi:MAG TPA: ABC transporter ATP-binding protein, partial [Pantoea ananatis]|nr:ABC transporter ATP-binding protein [Pantoea ananatis]